VKILLIPSSDYVGHPFPQRYNYLFEQLQESGDDVHVLRYTFSRLPRITTKTQLHPIPLELQTRSLGSYYLLNFMSHNIYSFYLVANGKFDCVVVSNLSPSLLGFIARSLHLYKEPIFFDVQDYFPAGAAQFIAGERTTAFNLLHSVFSKIMKISIVNATGVTCASRLLVKYAMSVGVKNPMFLPNGIAEHFMKMNTQESNRIRTELGLDDAFVLGYVGSIEFWLDFHPVLEALAKLVKDGLNVALILVGGKLRTRYEDSLIAYIREIGLQNHVIRLGFVPNQEVPKYIGMMDIGLMPFDPSNPVNYYLEEPLKMWEYISQGVPVLSSPISGIKIYSSDFCTIYRSPSDIYELVKGCIQGPILENLKEKTKLAREFAIVHRSWKKLARDFRTYLSSNLHN